MSGAEVVELNGANKGCFCATFCGLSSSQNLAVLFPTVAGLAGKAMSRAVHWIYGLALELTQWH